MSYSPICCPEARRDRGAAEQDRAVVRRLVVVAEDRALPGREGDDEAHALAVLGDVGESEPPHGPRRGRRLRVDEVAALPSDPPRLRGSDAGQRLEQLRLAVAGDARHAHDLAPPHREADPLDALHAETVLDHEVGHLEHRLTRAARRLVHAQAHRAAHHQLGELLRRRLGRGQGRDDLPLAHHGDDVGDLADLAQLVGDEDDGLALAAQRSQDAEEVVDLLRRQDGRRLVEDQDVGAPVERLEDLDALSLADAEIADARLRVDLEVVLPTEARQLGAGPRHPGPEPKAALDAEHDVLQHRERLHQHEVLVHHADPRRQRVLGAADAHRAGRARGSPRGRAGSSRRGCPSGSTCRRRSRPRSRGSSPAARRATRPGWRATAPNDLSMPRNSMTGGAVTWTCSR